MPRRIQRSLSPLETIRLRIEREKLLLLRIKRQKEERQERRRSRPDAFDRMSDSLGRAIRKS
ncbi:hypothetical protein HK107_14705 [Parvularcula sp. ZS-1/3]|uniref:Uncharacterized protein n=1 Tax=Parvularcula mediterranea TaxID=2732508 RepID=A0A7Y3RNX2_9PROT|nr:hypothetical protein [Parvularcula mediterranea]NNU17579.1 hypothetical protein [Parvularcula mediterranea]